MADTIAFGPPTQAEYRASIKKRDYDAAFTKIGSADFTMITQDSRIFTCPITQEWIQKPALGEDGVIYEQDAIKRHFESKNISPCTRQQMSSTLYPCHFFNKFMS